MKTLRKLSHPTLGILFIGSFGAACILLALIALSPAAPVVVWPTITPYHLPEQCSQTGEAYQLQVPVYNAEFDSITVASPDGRFAVVKEDVAVYLKDTQSGDLKQIVVEGDPTSGIKNRTFWSPDSQHVLFSPINAYHPLMIEVDFSADIQTWNTATINFNSWSPNSKYLFFPGSSPDMGSLVYEAATRRIVYEIAPATEYPIHPMRWSPDGEWLAYFRGFYLEADAVWQNTIVLGKMDSSEEYVFPIDSPVTRGNLRDDNVSWSPDSQKVVLFYTLSSPSAITKHFDIFTTDNQRLPSMIWDAAKVTHPYPPGIFNRPIWDFDSQFLSDVRYLGKDRYGLVNYYPAEGKTITLSDSLYKSAFYSPVSNRIGLYTRTNNNLYTLDLINFDGSNRVRMIEGASDAGDPNWSPDGQWVAAVWATMEHSNRQITLSWMHPNGTARINLQNDFTDVRDLRWLPNDKLAYIAWYRGTGNNLEIVDLKTGERQVVIGGLESLPTFTYDAHTDRLEFKWRAQDGTFGYDAYHPDGTRAYHVLMTRSFERPAWPFWSPDGKTVVFKYYEVGYLGLRYQMVIIGYADGSPPLVLRSNLTDLGNPTWSPDSRQFAFTQLAGNGLTLEFFRPSGEHIYGTSKVRIYQPLEWSACP